MRATIPPKARKAMAPAALLRRFREARMDSPMLELIGDVMKNDILLSKDGPILGKRGGQDGSRNGAVAGTKTRALRGKYRQPQQRRLSDGAQRCILRRQRKASTLGEAQQRKK